MLHSIILYITEVALIQTLSMAGNNVEIEWLKGLGSTQDFGATLSTVPENQPGHFDEIERPHHTSSTLKVCLIIFSLLSLW